MTALAFAAVLVVLVVQAVQFRRLAARLAEVENDTATALAELRCQSHWHPAVRRHDHEPTVSKLFAGETTRSGCD